MWLLLTQNIRDVYTYAKNFDIDDVVIIYLMQVKFEF